MEYSTEFNKHTISVVVTVHNNIDFLSICLDSICNQTYRDLEIILVDDGSDDGSMEVCDEYALKDDRIRVIHKPNEGVVKARKIGCQASTGEYIAIIDADDWLDVNMFEKLHYISESQNVDISMCGRVEEFSTYTKVVRQGFEPGRYDKKALLKNIYPNMIVNKAFFEWGIFPSYWDKLFRRNSIIPYVLNVDETIPMGNDAAGVYPSILNASAIFIIDDCLYHYRQYQSSTVHKTYDRIKLSQGFRTLFQSVNESFFKYRDIYDCREQWRKYVLFLMIPRADMLYKGMENLDYLFPFSRVKKGDSIVIYGMGVYGKRLYDFVEKSGFCKIVTAVDRNYALFQESEYRVDSPDTIGQYSFDYVVIAMSYAETIGNVSIFLKKHVDPEKIETIDESEVFSEKTMMALGLL